MFYSPYMGIQPGIIFLIPAILLAMYAQAKVQRNFNQYLHVESIKGYTGARAARLILDRSGLQHVVIELTQGYLSDHYDPRIKVLRLSPQVYHGTSIASVSVAAHEAGHAMQHDRGYVPLVLRNMIAPVASFGSRAVWFLVFAGFVLGIGPLIDLGILFYIAAVVFQVITLPVEFNASARALEQLELNGIITAPELQPSKKVLNAAALTYVAAMAVSLAQLLRLFMLRGRRD